MQIPLRVCFHIRKSPDQRLFTSFPELIAGFHVLHRLSIPRHPPYTLKSLTIFIEHRHNRAGYNSCSSTNLSVINMARSPKKVLDDTCPRQKDQCAPGRGHGNFKGQASDSILRRLQTARTDEPYSNLTYSLVKEHLYGGQTLLPARRPARMRERKSRFRGVLSQIRAKITQR
jgi:hypothetical protein